MVFYATLNDDNAGSYNFTLVDNLDHPTANTEDDLNLDLRASPPRIPTATPSSGTFSVVVDDDAPVLTAPVTQHSVDEEGLASASTHNDPYAGDLPGIVLTASDSLNIAWGATMPTTTPSSAPPATAPSPSTPPSPLTAGISPPTGSRCTSCCSATARRWLAIPARAVPTATNSRRRGVLRHPRRRRRRQLQLHAGRQSRPSDRQHRGRSQSRSSRFTAKDSDGDTVERNLLGGRRRRRAGPHRAGDTALCGRGRPGERVNAGTTPYAGDLPGIVLTASDSLNIAWGADNADNDPSSAPPATAPSPSTPPSPLTA